MSNMLGFLSDIGDIIKIGIILAVVILLMVLLLKFKNGKWILAGVMAVALVVCGVFTSFANYTYFTIEGGTFGSFGDIFANKNKVTQKDLSFEFENFVLVSTGIDGEFSARLSIEAVDETLIGKSMYVNNSPTKLTGVGENYIFSEYSYIFKDENLTSMLTDTLTIKFVFNSKKSECLLSTSGGSDAVKYWNSYLKKNKFNVEIKEANYTRDEQLRVDDVTIGLFKTGTKTLIKSWNDLLNDGDITITNGALKCVNTELSGDLVCGKVLNLTSLNKAFYQCKNLTSIDCSRLDTSNVTDMANMFLYCENVKTINVSNFNTTKVTDMSRMFADCYEFSTLDLLNFDTSNVTDMSNMFSNCLKITTLDLSNFDTSNVTMMYSMFEHCKNLTNLNLSSFNTINVEKMDYMFYFCEKITTLDLSNFDTSSVRNMSYMFQCCYKLESLNLSNFDTRHNPTAWDMFKYSSNLHKENIIISDTYTLNNLPD